MSSEQLVLLGAAIAAVSGLSSLLFERTAAAGQRLATVLLVAGNACSLSGAWQYLSGANSIPLLLPSPVDDVSFSLQVDSLSVVFLLPILLMSTLGSLYGLSYWKQWEHPHNGRKLSIFWGTLTASIALLVLARDGLTFLFAWEVMAVSAFILVATEDHDAEVRQAGWLYIAASHLATLSLFVMFALLGIVTHSLSLTGLSDVASFAPGSGLATTIFFLGLVGFGIKAGLMPFHVWLPASHANAPSHVSAMLSGVLIKMGIYGLVRVCGLLPTPPLWWGGLLLILGIVSGVLGVVYAIGQHDIKRLLAYHSIENIGIIVMGLGLAMMGRALGRTDWQVLGLGGALLHVWNHALFKSLLFLSAGSVVHATHTREIDLLGGLLRRMPHTAMYFLVGAVAICGLPPLNGFVSEWFVYLGLFHTLETYGSGAWLAAALGIPALALMGALAAACFAKVFGAVFLGAARSRYPLDAHESSPWMIFPMVVLAAFCLMIGVIPWLASPLLDQAIAAWSETPGVAEPLAELTGLRWISIMASALLAAVTAGWIILRWRLQTSDVSTSVTWDCGYAAPAPTMQYTSSSFAQILVELFRPVLMPEIHAPVIEELFPKKATFESHVPDVVLDRVVWPVTHGIVWVLSWFRYLQQGNIHIYLFYMFAIVLWMLWWR